MISASITRTSIPPSTVSQDPSGSRAIAGRTRLALARMSSSAPVEAMRPIRSAMAKLRSASSSIPGRRQPSSRGAMLVSPMRHDPNAISMTVRVPQATTAINRSIGYPDGPFPPPW
ncbi:hypothetical protein Lesp01_04260 [Lentzea sp. NBRC 102530]|nr:hypothetical protein Lesp01_04260 [Lentzea sp. NBRC 102530]